MDAVREFPPNPHALLVHTERMVTEEIVETYVAGSSQPTDAWVRQVLEIPGVRVLSLNAYVIRLQKHKDVGWEPIVEPFERIVRERFGIPRIRNCVVHESPRRQFSWHGEPLPRRVFEGKLQAQPDPLARALFDVPGVAEVILDEHRVEVSKCPLCRWQDIAPRVEKVLAQVG